LADLNTLCNGIFLGGSLLTFVHLSYFFLTRLLRRPQLAAA